MLFECTTTAPPAAVGWLSECHRTLVGRGRLAVLKSTVPVEPGTCWHTARELGSVLLEYARHSADPATLDEAVAVLRTVVENGPADGLTAVENACLLGVALHTRFRRHGDEQDRAGARAALMLARSRLGTTDDETAYLTEILDTLTASLLPGE